MEKLRFMGSRSCYYLLHPHKTTTERKQQQQQQNIGNTDRSRNLS